MTTSQPAPAIQPERAPRPEPDRLRFVRFFRELDGPAASLAGGKGRTLARLLRAGHPVPDGFVVMPAAFEGDALRGEARQPVLAALSELRAGDAGASFAARSSARDEDSAGASFAGAFETVLDVKADEDVLRAVERVRSSRHSGRVASYLGSHGGGGEQELAVVVQRLVRADLAGVLFTVDPVTGDRKTMAGNAVHGLGEQLVSGEVTAPSFTLRRPRGAYAGPRELKRHARALFRVAGQLERELGGPQDIEWAIAGGRLALLQARPITTLRTSNPETGERNDSLTGDFLWTNANVGEAMSDVMTPLTWSLAEHFFRQIMPMLYIDGLQPMGSIGGRLYVNLSLMSEMGAAFGMNSKKLAAELGPVFGQVPAGVEIPRAGVSIWKLLPRAFRHISAVRREQHKLPGYKATAADRCEATRARLAVTTDASALLALWEQEVLPYLDESARMLGVVSWASGDVGMKLRKRLQPLVDDDDLTTLCSHGSTSAGALASLGPLLGLEQLSRGEIDRAAYVRAWGHRGSSELEISSPRPGEDPEWLDKHIAGARDVKVNVTELLQRQSERHAAAKKRLHERHPIRAKLMEGKLKKAAWAARLREDVRSELVRGFWTLRAFALRAGELTGLGSDIFFLGMPEVLDLLRGQGSEALRYIPLRRATYERYKALPQLPCFIRGRFDPFRWAEDPHRRIDYFDARGGPPPARDAITGFPGASGVVEGVVRVLSSPAEGDLLRPGEILVTASTNIGWTPLFPRVAAIVTDVGAPLSHAAIVARELGIPAVVGCNDATARLRTGDRVRVNGVRGTVERVAASEASPASQASP